MLLSTLHPKNLVLYNLVLNTPILMQQLLQQVQVQRVYNSVKQESQVVIRIQ